MAELKTKVTKVGPAMRIVSAAVKKLRKKPARS